MQRWKSADGKRYKRDFEFDVWTNQLQNCIFTSQDSIRGVKQKNEELWHFEHVTPTQVQTVLELVRATLPERDNILD